MSSDTIVITIVCIIIAICVVLVLCGPCRKAGFFKDCCKDVKHHRTGDAVPSSSTSYGQLQLVV